VSAGRAIAAIQAARAHATRHRIDPYQLARAEALLFGYHARWIDDVEKYDVIAVESEFRAPLVNPATGAESKTFRLAASSTASCRSATAAASSCSSTRRAPRT
jgi:hypothetical protein